MRRPNLAAFGFAALIAGCSSSSTNPYAFDLGAYNPNPDSPDMAQTSPDFADPKPDMATLPSAFDRIDAASIDDFNGICGAGAALYIGATGGYVQRFSDLSKSWGSLNTGAGTTFFSVYNTTITDVWAPAPSGKLAHTIDGGDSWTVTPGTTPLYAVWGPDPQDVFVFGAGGKIMETTNLGKSFTTLTSGTTANLLAAGGFSNQDLYAVGENGTIRHATYTTLGGLKWGTSPSGTTQTLTGVYVINGGSTLVIGSGGTILRSTDKGVSWKAENSGTTENLVAVAGLAGGSVYAVGNKGTVVHLISNSYWRVEKSGTTDNLTGVYVDSQDRAWIVGPQGLLLRSK